ncbi:ATP-binding cassette domain-containing protein [Lysobacter maris]|uniref:ATP-binding cassette domain-containing protein n=1 Tax=Marilutibacter maris TaxID=1605891 RepID=A0A508AG47_9GAMM|nr:ABC transporter ATP-binding protein [Lysobacter maris]KAB8179312.1 ATP-binding cassette domain-containing protein [Lysobacter maris]
MYLRADSVSLYFPAKGIDTSHSSLHGAEHPRLGGSPVRYNGGTWIRALDNISLSLTSGQRLGLIGHNGSGKSTLLRTLAGLYHPQRGQVTSQGRVSGIFNMTIGFRQEATGYRNIVLKGLMARRSRREIDAVVSEIADFTGLGPYLDMPLRTYSQGMALRLAFAITTTFAHDILIMDEWIGAGDAEFQEKVVNRMNSVLEAAHICVVASHNNSLLRRVTDECLWLEDGRIRAYGSTSEVLEAYEDETRSQRLLLEEASRQPRLPIPDGVLKLRELPCTSSPDPASTKVQLIWNVARFNVSRTRLAVRLANGEEKLIGTGPADGERTLGAWIRAGMEFRLYDDFDGELLGSVTTSQDA